MFWVIFYGDTKPHPELWDFTDLFEHCTGDDIFDMGRVPLCHDDVDY